MAIGDLSLANVVVAANSRVDIPLVNDRPKSAQLTPALALDGGSLTSLDKPRSAPLDAGSLRSSSSPQLMASAFTFPSFNPVEFASRALSGGPAALEAAVLQLSALSKTAPQLAGQALRALTSAAGGATAFARMVANAGAPVFRAVVATAAACSAVQLSAALVIAGGILGLIAEPAGMSAEQEKEFRARRPKPPPLPTAEPFRADPARAPRTPR